MQNEAGRIVRPLRFNGVPYSGINILMLWAESTVQGFSSPTWMTYRQASELNAHVRKGEKGSLVVYANSITRTEEDGQGEESEREIHYMKGYTVFNVEQIEDLALNISSADANLLQFARGRIGPSASEAEDIQCTRCILCGLTKVGGYTSI